MAVKRIAIARMRSIVLARPLKSSSFCMGCWCEFVWLSIDSKCFMNDLLLEKEGKTLEGSVLRRPSKGKTLRVQRSDERRRAKPSGFSAPTTVEGQNPRGSVLRRPSKGKTLRVQCSDGCRRAKPSGFSALTSVEGQNLPGFRTATAVCGVSACGRGFSADVGRPILGGRRRVPAN